MFLKMIRDLLLRHKLTTDHIIQHQTNIFTTFVLPILRKFVCNGGTIFHVHLAELTRLRLVTQFDCTAADSVHVPHTADFLVILCIV